VKTKFYLPRNQWLINFLFDLFWRA